MPQETVFAGCQLGIEDWLPGEDGVLGKQLVIGDPASGHIYRYPMSADQAKIVGGKLLGLGDVQTASAADLASLLNGKGKLN
jgi:hypothetical protein